LLIFESVLLTLLFFVFVFVLLSVARWKKILVIVGPSILGAIVLLVLGIIGFWYFRTERRKRTEIKQSEIVLHKDETSEKQKREKHDKFSPQTGFIYGGSHAKSSSADCGVMV